METVWIYDWFPPRQGFCQTELKGPWAREGVPEVMAPHVQIGEEGYEDGGIRSLEPEISVV